MKRQFFIKEFKSLYTSPNKDLYVCPFSSSGAPISPFAHQGPASSDLRDGHGEHERCDQRELLPSHHSPRLS
jgi:hypothetical protein